MKLTTLKVKSLFGAAVLSACALGGTASATVVDLTTTNTGTINGAIFTTTTIQPTGTGVVDPFLTVQQNGFEQGYNGTNGNFDTKRVPQYTHEIKLGSLATVTLNSVSYYQFIVDINEPNAGTLSLISLDSLKIYTSSTLQTSTSTDSSGVFNGSLGTLRYNLDAGGNNYVIYDDKQSGSGSGDISIFIPTSYFAGASANDYVYMYQLWGLNASADLTTQGGFEETWAVLGAAPVPEVPAFLPLGGVLGLVVGANYLRRRKLASA